MVTQNANGKWLKIVVVVQVAVLVPMGAMLINNAIDIATVRASMPREIPPAWFKKQVEELHRKVDALTSSKLCTIVLNLICYLTCKAFQHYNRKGGENEH